MRINQRKMLSEAISKLKARMMRTMRWTRTILWKNTTRACRLSPSICARYIWTTEHCRSSPRRIACGNWSVDKCRPECNADISSLRLDMPSQPRHSYRNNPSHVSNLNYLLRIPLVVSPRLKSRPSDTSERKLRLRRMSWALKRVRRSSVTWRMAWISLRRPTMIGATATDLESLGTSTVSIPDSSGVDTIKHTTSKLTYLLAPET